MPASILTGAVDPIAVREEIGRDGCLDLLRQMLLVRRFEERCASAYQQKKIAGFLHLYIGQEAVATGILANLGPDDYVTTSYRCHAQALLLGLDPKELMAELYGKVTGNVRGKGGSMHFFSKERNFLGGHGIVGGQTPVGTGAAFAAKYRKTGGVSVVFLGDGAVAQGTFHESLNLASLWSLPAIYVIENNQYGMGTAAKRAVAVSNMAEAKAPGYAMTGFTVDGLDLFACYATAREAVDYVRRTSRPLVIEAKTYRYFGHSISDPGKYRSKDEVAKYRALDPIERLAGDLEDLGWLDPATRDELDANVRERIQEAVAFAEESPEPPLEELFQHVLA